MIMSKQRFIPDNAQTRNYPEAAVVVYCYQTANGKPAYVAYKGRQSKPRQFSSFSSEERLEAAISNLVTQETEVENFKRARRETAHGLEVGDVLYSEWGYEQTNVNYYQVIRVVSGRSVVIRELRSQVVAGSEMAMSGKRAPILGEFVSNSKEQTRRATGFHRVSSGKDGG
jgi:hypothetical protein